MRKTVLLSAAALLTAGTAFAGTVTTNTVYVAPATGTQKVAAELVNASARTAGSPLVTSLGAKVSDLRYSPSDIPLTTLTDGLVQFNLSAGSWVVPAGLQVADGSGLIVCEVGTGGAADAPVATFKIASAGSMVFDKGNVAAADGGPLTGSITNGRTYYLAKGTLVGGGALPTCGALTAADLQATVPPGTTSANLSIKLGISSDQNVRDEAAFAPMIQVQNQYTATITTKADAVIDTAAQFKAFTGGAHTDTIVVTLAENTALDQKTYTAVATNVPATDQTAAGDSLNITLHLNDITALVTGAGNMEIAGPGARGTTTCTLTTATKTIVCPSAGKLDGAGTALGAYTILLTVDGTTPINEKTITADAEATFGNATTIKARTIANNYELFKTADAGNWSYNATSIYIPVVRTDGTNGSANETYFRIFSADTTPNANGVKALVYTSTGTQLVNLYCNGDVAQTTVPSNASKGGCLFTGSDVLNIVGAAAFNDQDGTTKNFPMKLIVITDKANISGYATQIVNSTTQRRVPLFAGRAATGGAFDN